jgi:hypothetical protein
MGVVDLLKQAAALAVLRRPRSMAAPLGAGAFVAVALLYLLLGLGLDYAAVEPPRAFFGWAFGDRAFVLLFALLLGSGLAHAATRPALALRLATLLLLVGLPLQLVAALAGDVLHEGLRPRLPRPLAPYAGSLLLASYGLLVIARMLGWVGRHVAPLRRYPAALLAAMLVALAAPLLPGSSWWWPQALLDGSDPATAAPRPYSAEALLYSQPARIEAAAAELAPQRPGQIDVFAVGFAGDGAEGVFRNEVEHFERLLAQRFGQPGRTIALINHPGTLATHPLATRSNLRHALQAVAARMDPDEDLLLLFLTSHGSQDHALHVALDDLPLDPVGPEDLRAALDEAGIGWRILVVSACYSGGFIDALQSPRTLVVTAARADRPSFGCGVDSEITWFGRAFLVDALNATLDLPAAFEQARAAIHERERERDERASHPQLAIGEQIAPYLQQWLASIDEGPQVEFVPAVPAGADHGAPRPAGN